MSPSHILIVEGTAAVGKTTLCSALIRQVASQERVPSLFNFRQSFTYHPLNPDHPSTFVEDDRVKSHLDDFWSQVRSLSARPGYILIESLHWTLSLRPGVQDQAWLRTYEQRLHEDGAKLLLLIADEERHRTQLATRSGSEFFSTYGRKYGASEELVIQHYRREQQTICWIE